MWNLQLKKKSPFDYTFRFPEDLKMTKKNPVNTTIFVV